MIIDEVITKKAPVNVFIEGISFQIKYPKIIAKTKAKYFRGVTNETSENLYDWLNHKFAAPPNIPIDINKIKSFISGIIQPNGIVKKLAKVIVAEKYSEINQTGSDVDNCLIVIAT